MHQDPHFLVAHPQCLLPQETSQESENLRRILGRFCLASLLRSHVPFFLVDLWVHYFRCSLSMAYGLLHQDTFHGQNMVLAQPRLAVYVCLIRLGFPVAPCASAPGRKPGRPTSGSAGRKKNQGSWGPHRRGGGGTKTRPCTLAPGPCTLAPGGPWAMSPGPSGGQQLLGVLPGCRGLF